MDASAAPQLQPKKSSSGLLWGCLGCIGIPAILLGIFFAVSAANREPYEANNQYEAIAQCEARIREMLKAPTTARFDSSASGGGTWRVTGTVDAENSFGAMIRSHFGCTVVIAGDRATTTVDYLE